MKNGIRSIVYYRPEYGGYGFTFIKQSDGKFYRLNVNELPWIETSEYSAIEPVIVSEFTDGRSEGEKGNLHGENLALKNEVTFLREQVAKLLEKIG